ncbi:MAG TPA: hypothetical protein VF950_24150 [Planctomycetota bacterium]
MPPFFRVPLNLPHAATISARIRYHRQGAADESTRKLVHLLDPYREREDNPPPEEAKRVADEAAALARQIVDEIEAAKVGHDRLGQAIRNFFECLTLGEEGAAISLRAGENPKSSLRPQ